MTVNPAFGLEQGQSRLSFLYVEICLFSQPLFLTSALLLKSLTTNPLVFLDEGLFPAQWQSGEEGDKRDCL